MKRSPNYGWAFATPKAKSSHDETDSMADDGMRYPQNELYDDSDEDGSEEYDDELPPRQRSRSLGDAEDILNSPHYYYESFSLEQGPDLPAPGETIQTKSKGLHHRHTGNNGSGGSSSNGGGDGVHHRRRAPRTPRQPPSQYELYQTPTPKRKPLHPGYLPHSSNQYQHQHHFFSLRRPSLLKCGLALGFGCYLLLLIRSSIYLWSTKEDINRHRHAPIGDVYATTGPHWLHAAPHLVGFAGSSSSWSQDRVMMERTSRANMEERARQRRKKTRPDSPSREDFAWYPRRRMDERAPTQGPPLPPSSSLASLDQLCGFTAQNASLAQPHHYPTETALKPSARVLITGILNPLGFNLAMHLHHRCGVQVIGGLDPMFPNTVQNRLQLIEERLELLHTTIPKLVKPIGLSFVGLDPKLDQTDEGFDYLAWKPTHIVHLAGYSPDLYSDMAVDPSWRNKHSPYVLDDARGPSPLYPLRSSMMAMEQLLQSIAKAPSNERPQIVYASATEQTPLFSATKYLDEVMAETYGLPSIALRLPNALYGPWGRAGSTVHDLMEETVTKWNTTAHNGAPISPLMSPPAETKLNLVHVDDAIEAIVATMQYRTAHALAIDITSAGTPVPVPALSAILQSFKPGLAKDGALPSTARKFRQAVTTHPALAEWQPRVPLREGLLQTMAWHLHRHAPYGQQDRVETGDTFLKRQRQPTCHANDWMCHKSKQYVPCLSECNVRDQCLPSIFDDIKPLVQSVTEGCDIVLYTQSLGYNVQEMPLQAEYMDDSNLKADDKLVCNFAFVPRDSDLVSAVTQKVPNEQLTKFGIKPQKTDWGKDMRERKLDGLNGRLLYRGWILLWVPQAVEELSLADRSLLKLSPGKLFHQDVRSAVFMEENFSVSPKINDVFFLVGEMSRKPFPKRTLKKDVHHKSVDGRDVVKRQKFRLPPEPRRRAAILFSPLRIPNNPDDSTVKRYKQHGEKKLNVHDAAKFMRYELDMEDPDKEPPRARQQREFYEKIPSYINRNSELRSIEEPWYRYSMRHWVRSRWVVHDVHMEESRLLRCDWYQEHLQWGTELDQLSFASIMATRELKRRMAHSEPDDHVKSFIEQHPHLKDLTDSHEWHPMETDANQLFREPVHWTSAVPDHFMVEDEATVEDETAAVQEDPHEPTPLYVRIISERVMAASRQMWDKSHRKGDKSKDKRHNDKKKKHK